jgi:hypothetical protein
VDYETIRATKRGAHARLLAIPGVHCVAIGAKVVAGKATADVAIQVFLPRKRPAAELSPAELVPAEIDGIKTDIIEEPMARLLATTFPDKSEYTDLSGGMQIQAGNSVTGTGTLGCIATPTGTNGPVYAITNHHVVALWSVQQTPGPNLWHTRPGASPQRIVFSNRSAANLRLVLKLTLNSSAGSTSLAPVTYTTTAADTLTTIASQVASLVNGLGNASITAATGTSPSWPQVTLNLASGCSVQMEASFEAMWAQTSANTATLMGVNVPGAIISAQIWIQGASTIQPYAALYKTVASDTLATAAQGICHEINVIGIAGVQCSNAGAVVTLAPQSGTTILYFVVNVFQPTQADPDSDLQAQISDQQLTISGAVSSDTYGLYPALFPGGLASSSGGFYAPPKKATTTAVTNSVFMTLSHLNVSGVAVTSSGPQTIIVGNVDEVDCPVTSDVRVGQPTNDFCSDCSSCCGDRTIGRVSDASLEHDIALIQLDPNTTYKVEILDVGYVAAPGSHAIQPQEIPPNGTFYVQKRGRTTGITYGSVQSIDAFGIIASDVFHRVYTGAMVIKSLSPGVPFSDHGDSGSAVLTCGTTPPPMPPNPPLPGGQAVQVVGILFAGGGATTWATPIQPVLDRFNIQIATTTQLNQVLKAPAASASVSRTMQSPSTPQTASLQHAVVRPKFEYLRQIEQQMVTTAGGEKLVSLVRKHVPETRLLINTNRRVATTWHRCGGPTLLNALVRSLQRHDVPVPREIDGKPLGECLQRMRAILGRYGSPSLVADVNEYFAHVADIAGLTYAQVLTRLQGI